MKPPWNDETAIPNAATIRAKAMIPFIAEWMGNHHFAVVVPLAYRGTSTPSGRTNIVATAPQAICARSSMRFRLDCVLLVPVPVLEVALLPDAVGGSFLYGARSDIVIPPEARCWLIAASPAEDFGFFAEYAQIRSVLAVVLGYEGSVKVKDVV